MADSKFPQSERSHDKFPKTRTFPEGWDMSGMEASSNGKSAMASDAGHCANEQDAQAPRSPEKFPKTTTMPSGWIF
ncbi:hypothetical protein ADN00_19075 [Ornatilinea apprima]|uniref:Uncharacterized protein n=1 Tax=Ornatilinea apprima TaxID=1134406 RepID=A0A0N8GKM8_9CHLR|nr:hypothetical protein [Ornatilinea apprima]KPL70138.1 hypothetical protein ADN00_19075 [Ornatilinea apprima]